MSNVAHEIAVRHFGRKGVAALARKGIRIIGLTTIPGTGAMSYANGETGYSVDDNGTGRILTFMQVAERAK